jgi:hypothetical protein
MSFFQVIHRTTLAAALVSALSLGALAPSARAAQGLLVVSQTNGRVLHYDGATGAFKGVFLSAGLGGLSQVSDLTLGPDGKLYVGSADGVLLTCPRLLCHPLRQSLRELPRCLHS